MPLTLVNAAVEAGARNSEEQGEIDEVWCLFDVEWPKNHPKLREARAKAEESTSDLPFRIRASSYGLCSISRTTRRGSTTRLPGSCSATTTRVRAKDWTARTTCPGELTRHNVRVL